MSSDDTFRSFSFEEFADKARWYKEDLDSGAGWRLVYDKPGVKAWMKCMPEEEAPMKFLRQHDMRMSAEHFLEVISPKNHHYRQKWDKIFTDIELLEEYPNDEGWVTSCRFPLSWPLADRDFVLFVPPAREIDWFGKRAFLQQNINAWHPSKPANVTWGCVRATNGGNFDVVIPDDTEPEKACTVFALSHNRYNGWLPERRIERLLSRSVPRTFAGFFDGIVEGQKMLYPS